MDEHSKTSERFEEHRSHLQAVAYRMLGSLDEADDAVQEAWLRLDRAGEAGVENLGGWLTTVVARVCLDRLRSRKARREEPLGFHVPDPVVAREDGGDPEHQALLADAVGLALLVVLERLAPAERLAFVLHDMFAIPFEEIAPIVGRSPAAARQLASRARRRVQGPASASSADLARQRDVVDAFLSALRAGDIQGLLEVPDPDLVVRADAVAASGGAATEVRGAEPWAKQALAAYRRGARSARAALVDGAVGVVIAPRGRLFRVLTFTISAGKIVAMDVVGDPARLGQLEVAVLDR